MTQTILVAGMSIGAATGLAMVFWLLWEDWRTRCTVRQIEEYAKAEADALWWDRECCRLLGLLARADMEMRNADAIRLEGQLDVALERYRRAAEEMRTAHARIHGQRRSRKGVAR